MEENIHYTVMAIKQMRPDMRYGQIIANAVPPRFNGDPYYLEDEELFNNLTDFLNKVVAHAGK